jgi:hypothetical protein
MPIGQPVQLVKVAVEVVVEAVQSALAIDAINLRTVVAANRLRVDALSVRGTLRFPLAPSQLAFLRTFS